MSTNLSSHEEVIVDQGVLALPNKVRYPIQALRDQGYLDNKTLYTAFMAEPEPYQYHKLMYYIAVIKGLRDARVEVDDVVSMAVTLGRKVSLSWSHPRWNDEHNRMSRMMTLKNLAGQSVDYDLAAYECRLPAKWSGYLVKTSRRLGMEGLRQRHCVASYHDRIASGQCAIAVVFINHVRWTIELYLNAESLKVRQIKSRRNRGPSESEVDAILEQLKLPETALKPDPVASLEVRTDDRRQTAKETLRQCLPELQALGISCIAVTFDGGGDSGMIEKAEYTSAKGDWACNVSARVDDLVNEAVENYIDSTDVDWFNNEGGYGEFTIDIDEAVYSCDIVVRYSEANNAFYEEESLID